MTRTGHHIQFILDGRLMSPNMQGDGPIKADTSLLNYLRHIGHSSVKEGCGEGDCGACTVVIAELSDGVLHYKAINSCLVLLPMVHACQVITAESLSSEKEGKIHLHPVQQAMVDHHGSQCGYCTPGIVMSLFALWKDHPAVTTEILKHRLAGNLCRCTGYQPIIEAFMALNDIPRKDHFTDSTDKIINGLNAIKEKSSDIIIQSAGIEYYKPGSLKAALQLRSEHPDATIIGGATDVSVAVNKRKQNLKRVLDISALEELKIIEKDETLICLGSGISMEELGKAIKDEFTALHDIIMLFGSHQIRNLATPAGNIASASPIGDLLPVLMAYGCEVVLQNIEGKRTMPLEDFVSGYHETKLEKDELISAICLPLTRTDKLIRSYKISKRKDVDISSVSAAFSLYLKEDSVIDEIKLFYGGMAATVVKATEAEDFLKGKEWTEENALKASGIIRSELKPISDARSGAEGRSIMAANLLIRFWEDSI